MALSKEQIREKAAAGPKIHPLKVQAWDGEEVALQELDGLQIFEWDQAGAERAKNAALCLDRGTGAEHMIRLSLVECKYDGDGQPIRGTGVRVFGDGQEDILKVRTLGGALQEIYSKCLAINRMLRSSEEETEKNLLKAPSSGSGAS